MFWVENLDFDCDNRNEKILIVQRIEALELKI